MVKSWMGGGSELAGELREKEGMELEWNGEVCQKDCLKSVMSSHSFCVSRLCNYYSKLIKIAVVQTTIG